METKAILVLISIFCFISPVASIIGREQIELTGSSEFVNYLYFGFQTGGKFTKIITIESMKSPITHWTGNSKKIESLTDSKFSFASFINMVTLDPYDKLLSFPKEECLNLSKALQKKGSHITIDNNLTTYAYVIDHNTATIRVDLSGAPTKPSSAWLNYPGYKIEATHQDKIGDEDFYYFFLSSGKSHSTMAPIIDYLVENPGHEHLSLDLIPNKITYLVFGILWIIVSTFSVVCLVLNKVKKDKFYCFNILIVGSFFTLTLYGIAQYVYWMYLSKTGRTVITLDMIIVFFEVLTMSYFLLMITMISTGYKIVHRVFQGSRGIKSFIIIFFIIATSLLMKYSHFYLMIFMLVEIIILILLLKMDIDSNLSQLRDLLKEKQENEYSQVWLQAIHFKIRFFKIFMVYLYIYWTLEILVLSIRPMFYLYHEWIFELAHQILILFNMIFIFLLVNISKIKLFKNINEVNIPADERDIEQQGPLPFDKSRNPRIVGDIIVINSVSRNPQGVICVGVETSFQHRRLRNKNDKRFVHNQRSIIYKLSESSEYVPDSKMYKISMADEKRNIPKTKRSLKFDINKLKEVQLNCQSSKENDETKNDNRNSTETFKSSIDDITHKDLNLINSKLYKESRVNQNGSEASNRIDFFQHSQIKIQGKGMFRVPKIIDFSTQENISSFLELEGRCSINSISLQARLRMAKEAEKNSPIDLEMIKICLPDDF